MGVKDYIGSTKTVSSTLVYDQKELYRFLSKWFEKRQYDIEETNYTEKISSEGKKIYAFEWIAEKKMDDYAKIKLVLRFNAEAETISVEGEDGKKKSAQKGTVTAKFTGYLDKDIESDWALSKKTAYRTFMRELYDKVFNKGKIDNYGAQLSKDFNAIIADLKTYLKTHRYD
ncbi:hypothetical protein HZA98_03370 [Candidatus Woesearchaeota archaeon]|nr:hypothetical protein [Candidatus Woesearchaeota archaeon]